MTNEEQEKRDFPAHIRLESEGRDTVQSVSAHLRNTAQYAKEALGGAGLENAAYLAGLTHDIGKYT